MMGAAKFHARAKLSDRRAHIVRAALEAVCYQSADLFNAMAADCGNRQPERLRVDGGASANSFMMQFQADVLGVPVERCGILETTALGAALLAGIGIGLYAGPEEAVSVAKQGIAFQPRMDAQARTNALHGWTRAVQRSRNWVEKP